MLCSLASFAENLVNSSSQAPLELPFVGRSGRASLGGRRLLEGLAGGEFLGGVPTRLLSQFLNGHSESKFGKQFLF